MSTGGRRAPAVWRRWQAPARWAPGEHTCLPPPTAAQEQQQGREGGGPGPEQARSWPLRVTTQRCGLRRSQTVKRDARSPTDGLQEHPPGLLRTPLQLLWSHRSIAAYAQTRQEQGTALRGENRRQHGGPGHAVCPIRALNLWSAIRTCHQCGRWRQPRTYLPRRSSGWKLWPLCAPSCKVSSEGMCSASDQAALQHRSLPCLLPPLPLTRVPPA